MSAREFKDNIYGEIASVSKALANPHRLEIVELLAQGASSVEYVADQINLSVASASHHLQTLKKARLVSTKKKGKYRYYSLSNQHVFKVWKAMRELAFSQNAEINKLIADYRASQNNLEPITTEELKKRLNEGNALLIDVRPGQEYDAGHITSSLSVPKDELHRRIKDLPKDKEIVAYCRGPLCTMADEAVAELRQRGYKATKLDVGYPEWKIAKA
ncbi:ArsR/SmtB family transcription factor [Gracilimonas sp. Q87]|uniref:ArsR/SmtB family transcription factor n=1 Tax=Gracilimonas sp. Q87 TaxID=3384766 RepID=UPI0039842DB1